jgi:Tol biopolymer transport system component
MLVSWTALGLLMLGVVVAAGVGWWLVPRPPGDDESAALSTVRFSELYSWKSERGEAVLDARFSHDGTRIAFTALHDGSQTIWVKQTMNGPEPVPITKEKAESYWPIWSPDDQQLAFVSSKDGQNAIWSVPAKGGTPTLLKIINADAIPRTRYWSRDGKTIYYELNNNLHSLDVVSKTTSEITDLPALRFPYRHFSISPDETRVGYVDSKDGQSDVWVASIRGEDKIQVTNDVADDRYPIWHPDGKRIIYTSERGGAYQICVAHLDGRKPVQVTVGGTEHVVSDVSND